MNTLSIDTLLITDKKTHIIERKIQHKVGLDEHDMEYIQNHPLDDIPK